MKKHTVAILGFGIVGGGVARLITDNDKELSEYLGAKVVIKKILDLKDFPDSEFRNLIVHDYTEILNDVEIDTVIEVMGGSHPAYEFTVSALKAGKNVISSNKEVISRYGDEFLALARENKVCYRFEAAVGGGVPIIAPLISSVRQNKISEIRGIINGTTNYILTQMVSYGKSFDTALAEAQDKGFAEKNPDADILGWDAARKIAILTAIVTGRLFSAEEIHTEGIDKIRKNDVKFADSIGCNIKLLARCLPDGDNTVVAVAPYVIPKNSPLGLVSGVSNAIEVVGEPLGCVSFSGPGAGAGATASAVASDLAPIIAYGSENMLTPYFDKCEVSPASAFYAYRAKNYIAIKCDDIERTKNAFANAKITYMGDEYAILTEELDEKEITDAFDEVKALCKEKDAAPAVKENV